MLASPRPIRRLLIANRGEIARRIIRSARALALQTVVAYADADAHSLAVAEADSAVALGGTRSADTYLNIAKLLAAAQRSGADAVHPGYGFLSENPDFAQAVIDAGLVWVGPPPQAIRLLGSKAAVRQRALATGVPCLPGYHGTDQSDQRFAQEAQALGFPLMVKATAGGGGRGMRLVLHSDDLPAALHSARSEAQSSFGSADLLIERALLAPRHVEVQVFADHQGGCIHLGERDCSVQRRHQKIIEESPSPALDEPLRQRMTGAALRLVQGSGYVGAGTVEFLLQGADFFLMEMNTRLQVEHPVTEARTGLDLVQWQLRVAQGEPLPLAQHDIHFEGHAMELRLCAEDEQFQPHAGTVQHFQAPVGVRMDHALASGSVVPDAYDSMLGKLIAHAPSRAQAVATLQTALAQTQVLGLPSNRAVLAACLAHPVFLAGEATIPFLAQQADALRAQLQAQEQAGLCQAALAVLLRASPPPAALACPYPRRLRLRHRGDVLALTVQEQGQGELHVQLGAHTHTAQWQRVQADELDITLDGLRQRLRVAPLADGRCHVQAGGVEWWLEDVSYQPVPGAGQAQATPALRAPFNGRLIALHVQPGQTVQRGQTLATLESMKLEHALAAPMDGTVQALAVEPGQQVASGQLILQLQPVPVTT